MKIGLTGSAGLIGSAVLKDLDSKYEVICLDNFTRNLNINYGELEQKAFNLDWILHFGAKSSIMDSFRDPIRTYSNNINSTLIALKISQLSSASFVFMSSYVYGKPQYLPIDESHPVNAVNPYMSSKLIGEEICTQFCKINNIPRIILRPFNIYGDYKIPGKLISDLQIAVEKKIDFVLNDPKPKRDYLYIDDFVELVNCIVSKSQSENGIFNVGFGKSFSNWEVANLVKKITGNTLEIISKNKPRQNDILDCTVNIDSIKKTYNWSPKVSLEEGLHKIIQSNTVFSV